jgi:hypothetical protein
VQSIWKEEGNGEGILNVLDVRRGLRQVVRGAEHESVEDGNGEAGVAGWFWMGTAGG